MKHLFTLALLLPFLSLKSQNNVRGWYADGQVWIVWEYETPLPETYAIWVKPTAFNNTANATMIGRLFREEYLPFALKDQVDTALTYQIPNGQGGTYSLKSNEALFVATPHQAGQLFFAVTAWGQTAVTAGVNITQNAVPFQYNPAADPVECHVQKSFISPFDQNYRCFAFYMWADGRQNHWEGRPDFPIMANAAKNGMPSFFLISVPLNLDTTGGIALSVWLHGGGGTARQSLAGSRQDIRLDPKQGILLAHNDDLFGYYLTYYTGTDAVSKHFGWRKNYDPFTGEAPTTIDTVINYTQRRYIWIDEWLMHHYPIDPARININGHSMGSRGATMMAKAYPDHYASATVLNNGGADDDTQTLSDVVYGTTAAMFPTNLKGYDGQYVPFPFAPDYNTRLSNQRDLPLMRFYHAKNDTGNSNHWDAGVVHEFRTADSLGWGAQLNWSERAHGADTGVDYNDHWTNGNSPTQQTVLDDISYEETHFRSDVSFPAFFNHRLDPNNNDPGVGLNGINNGDGDNWGTWGAYHRWDNVQENNNGWQATAWLESNAVFANDNCPDNALAADLAIRKPRVFKPQTGQILNWVVKDAGTGQTLQNGECTVQADGLVVIPHILVYRENIRKVRISVFDPTIAAREPGSVSDIQLFPNPASGEIILPENISRVRVFDWNGRLVLQSSAFQQANPALDVSGLRPGIYFLDLMTEKEERKVGKFVKI